MGSFFFPLKKTLLFLWFWAFSVSGERIWGSTAEIEYLPVQDGGRVKPYGTFAREVLQLIHGRGSFQGKPAYEVVTTFWLEPELWGDKPLFEIKNSELRGVLDVHQGQTHLSWNELVSKNQLSDLFAVLNEKRSNKEKLDPFLQAVQRLESAMFVYRATVSGEALRVLPVEGQDEWLNLTQLEGQAQEAFLAIAKAFIDSLSEGSVGEGNITKAIQEFESFYPSNRVDLKRIAWEVHYQRFHPFRWAWVSYLLAGVVVLLMWILKKPSWWWGVWLWAIVALGFHVYGFVLRSYITGRAPVTNMYETVVWMGLGAAIFGMFIERAYRFRFVLPLASLGAAATLILSDLSPAVLDPSLQPLEPVLRSNFWLTIHVLTIVISYAGFFLAFILGNLGLYRIFRGESVSSSVIQSLALSVYRSIQIGVALLAPGIILGGVWAEYSWGRFWGWDPKEVWALVALLGYLAVLHARLVGWLKNRGLFASAVLCFNLVIMAWYGVNFVLGAGLHTYGFGAGGVEYVSAFVVANMAWSIFVLSVRRV